MTRDEQIGLLGFGFESCDIKNILMDLDVIIFATRFRLNWWHYFYFFATFSSVLRLQVTVLIRVSQIRWDCLLCLYVEPCPVECRGLVCPGRLLDWMPPTNA